MSFNIDQVTEMFLKMSATIAENKEYLTELDAAIGDGDHGINMSKGFAIASTALKSKEFNTIGDILKTFAMSIISHVGGASGPLYGTLFLKASAAVKENTALSINDFYNLLKEGIEGVKMRGKSTVGEKTMLDVLIPSLESLENSISKNLSTKETFNEMMIKAKEGLEFTKTIKATKGRASYLGDRSIGHIDPGAMSSYLLLNVISESV